MKPIHEIIGPNYSKTEFIRTCMTDFGFFMEKALGLKVAPFHLHWANMFYSNKRSSVMAFRGSTKTTTLGVVFPLWVMTFNKQIRKTHKDKKPSRFLIVSNTLKQSTRILREQQQFIRTNELLYNTLYPDSSREGRLMTKMDMQTKNDCLVQCRPYSENIRGEHPHYLLEEEASLFRDLKVHEGALLPLINTFDGNLMSIGTPLTDWDLLARHHTCDEKSKKLVDHAVGYEYVSDEGYHCSKMPVIIKGEPTWKWRYNLAQIEQLRREVGEITFAREFLCEIVSEQAQAIPAKKIAEALDNKYRLNMNLLENGNPIVRKTFNERTGQEEEQLEIPRRVTAQDLAMSADGDYTVSITLEEQGSGKWLLTHMDRKRGMGFPQHEEWSSKIFRSFQPMAMKLDPSQFGKALINTLRGQYGIPCDPYQFTPENRREGFARMIQMFENNQLILPYDKGDPLTLQMMDTLIYELRSLIPHTTPTGFTTYKAAAKHDDCAIALSMACSMIPQGQVGGFYMQKW